MFRRVAATDCKASASSVQNHRLQFRHLLHGVVRAFFAEQDLTCEFVFETGHAPEHIAHAATRGKYDLVVLGSHGHSALGGLVMGSVSSRVLAECKVPVLVTR